MVVPEYTENGIAIRQHADDTIVCIQDNVDNATNLKLFLYVYEATSGLKINFNKNEAVMIGQNNGRS